MRALVVAFGLAALSLAICSAGLWAASGPLVDGVAAYDRGEYDEAIRLLKQAVVEKPESPEAHCWLGVAYAQKATSSGGAGPLVNRAADELKWTVDHDPKGQWGKTAGSWLKRLHVGQDNVALGPVAPGEMPSRFAPGLRSDLVKAMEGAGLKVVFTSSEDNGNARARAKAEEARWFVSVRVTEWTVTDESVGGGLLGHLPGMRRTVPLTKARATAEVAVTDLESPTDTGSTLVAAAKLQPGQDDEARQAAERSAAQELPAEVARRLKRALDARGGSALTEFVNDKGERVYVPYVWVMLPQCSAIAGVESAAAAKSLPIVAVAPFSWRDDVEADVTDRRGLAEFAADAVARGVLQLRKQSVISPRELRRVTGVDETAYALPEEARDAGRKVGAHSVIVGEVRKVESWVNAPTLGDRAVRSSAEVVIRLLSCDGTGDGAELRSKKEAGSGKLSTSSDNARDFPDLVDATQRAAVAAAAADLTKQLWPEPPKPKRR